MRRFISSEKWQKVIERWIGLVRLSARAATVRVSK